MEIKKCNNSHFYDATKYTTCPYCQGSAEGAPAAEAQNTEPLMQTPVSKKTASSSANTTFSPAETPVTTPAPAEVVAPAVEPSVVETQETPQVAPQAPQAPQATPATPATPENAGKTVAMFAPREGGKSPVVGWLVCVEGEHFGEDFRLIAGKNFIGRNNSMDVTLSKDTSVSRDKHATIIFEPNHNLFIIQAGDSKQLSYLNGNVVLNAQELNANDKITVGQTVLQFIPLCGENFTWDVAEEKEEETIEVNGITYKAISSDEDD